MAIGENDYIAGLQTARPRRHRAKQDHKSGAEAFFKS